MIISIASGKGGTGKTTVSTNLAVSLDQPVTLLDCDVEEPNAQLFLKADISSSEILYSSVPGIDEQKCTGCGACVTICRFNALALINQSVMIFNDLCHSCGGCFAVCETGAVFDDKRELGTVEAGRKGRVTFIQGTLRVGEPMSPPLIKAVRERANGNSPTIIDAPPGTSCPVIMAVKNTDFVLLVTEPTPFGLHDLKIAVEAIKILGIPCGLVINRADIGDNSVHDYALQQNIPILLEIPFDRKIAEIYSQGKMIVEELPEWRNRFAELFSTILTLVSTEEASL